MIAVKMNYEWVDLKDGIPLTPTVCSLFLSAILAYDDLICATRERRAVVTLEIFHLAVENAKGWPNLKETDWNQIRCLAPLFGYESSLPEWKDLYFSGSEDKGIH